MPGLWLAGFRKYSKNLSSRPGFDSASPTNFVSGDTAWIAPTIAS